MWLISKEGFFSAVEHRDDSELVLIRSRARKDLVNLCELANQAGIGELDPSGILTNAGSDYRHRIIIPKADWAKLATLMAEQIDYDNFKNAIAREDRHRASIYSDVWGTLHQIQTDEPAND